MAGEKCSRRHPKDEDQSEWHRRRPCSPPIRPPTTYSQWKTCSPRKCPRFLELRSVQSSWRYLPTTRDLDEPIVCHVGVAGGIVKMAVPSAAFSSERPA